MKSAHSSSLSLRWALTAVLLACCIFPAVIITGLAGALMTNYYEDFFYQTAQASATHAMRQVEMRLAAAIEDSKSVSYDGEVRKSYRAYQQDGDDGVLYRTLNEYLSQKFSNNHTFQAVFITFLAEDVDVGPYVIRSDAVRYNTLQKYRSDVQPVAVSCAQGADTHIYFLEIDGGLYMIRNILSSTFEPYATLVMLCNQQELLQSLDAVTGVLHAQLTLDGIRLDAGLEAPINPAAGAADGVSVSHTVEVDGHVLSFSAQVAQPTLWGAMPLLRWALLATCVMITVLLLVSVLLFHRHVSAPIAVLLRATARVQAGERGYQIAENPRSREFHELFEHFNRMSTELKSQFERLYLEQQALQQARLKVLQSQINPHFLNNTLEIIGWEARMAENERVCAMTDALSLMMDAAVGRDGRSQIALREELEYTDAYLYIIKQRLGDRLSMTKEIDEALLCVEVPRLIVQPIVENAVEHDISAQRRSELCLRAYREGDCLFIEVEHDGVISSEDWARIHALLSAPMPEVQTSPRAVGSVGIQNVNQRLRLLYGEKGGLRMWEPSPGKVLAQLTIPIG